MTSSEFFPLLTCSICRSPFSIMVVKYIGSNQLRLVMKDQLHSSKQKVNTSELPKIGYLIKERIFKCHKCGGNVNIIKTYTSGPWTVHKVRCPLHGTSKRKISTSLYNAIIQSTAPVAPVPPVTAPVPPVTAPVPEYIPQTPLETEPPETNFCPECGSPASGHENYCSVCGASLQ